MMRNPPTPTTTPMMILLLAESAELAFGEAVGEAVGAAVITEMEKEPVAETESPDAALKMVTKEDVAVAALVESKEEAAAEVGLLITTTTETDDVVSVLPQKLGKL